MLVLWIGGGLIDKKTYRMTMIAHKHESGGILGFERVN